MLLTDREWKEFYIAGENGIFNLEATSSGIDKNKLNQEEGQVPYITRTENVNGINMFITDNQSGKYRKNKGNVITIGLDTQTVFYQSADFFTGQNIQILYNNNIVKYNAIFIITLMRNQIKKFNWGGNGATLGRLKRSKILLPVNIDGDPDYDYMEAYVKEQEEVKKKEYFDYIKDILANLKYKKIPALAEKEWKDFYISDIFNISAGKRLVSNNMVAGTTPFIGAIDSGNGITNYVSNTNESIDKNVLGVNYNGNGMVISFYHPYECIFTDDVKRFHLKEIEDNMFVLLFFKVVILQQKSKYNYGYKFNGNRMKRQKILVPISNKKQPDYDYMEQFIKNIMIKKYETI